MTSSTPKNSVNPTATSAYITPSIRPLKACWRSSSGGGIRRAERLSELLELQPGQGALAGGVLRVLPEHPLAVLAHVLRDERNGILAVVVELHGPDDGVGVLGPLEPGGDLGAVGTHGLDRVDDQIGGHVGEGTVGLGGLLEARLGVGLEEPPAPGQLLRGRALDEGERALGRRAGRLVEGVGLDAAGPLELGADAELVHLD